MCLHFKKHRVPCTKMPAVYSKRHVNVTCANMLCRKNGRVLHLKATDMYSYNSCFVVNSSNEWYDVSKFECQQNIFWAREWNEMNIFQVIIYCSSYYVFTTLITSIHFITASHPFLHTLTRTCLINPVSKLHKMIHLI